MDALIATINLPEHLEALNAAKPLVRALLDGDADDLGHEQLVPLAMRHADLREDWLNWITPDGSRAQLRAPILPEDLRAPAPPQLAQDVDTSYGQAVTKGWELLDAQQWKAAANCWNCFHH